MCLMKKRSVCPSWMFFSCRYSLFHRKLPQEKPERSFCTWMGWAFHLQSAQDQALTDPDTCYWEISSPSERYRTIPGQGHWAAIVLHKSYQPRHSRTLGTQRKQCVIHVIQQKTVATYDLEKKSHLRIVGFEGRLLWLCSVFRQGPKGKTSSYMSATRMQATRVSSFLIHQTFSLFSFYMSTWSIKGSEY